MVKNRSRRRSGGNSSSTESGSRGLPGTTKKDAIRPLELPFIRQSEKNDQPKMAGPSSKKKNKNNKKPRGWGVKHPHTPHPLPPKTPHQRATPPPPNNHPNQNLEGDEGKTKTQKKIDLSSRIFRKNIADLILQHRGCQVSRLVIGKQSVPENAGYWRRRTREDLSPKRHMGN